MEKWKSDKYWTSHYNYLEDFRKDLKLPKKIKIHDATLRDGEQTPGIVFSAQDKVEIAKMLDELGVDRIEAGMPAVSSQDKEAMKKITALGLKAKIFSFARANKEDIDLAVECGVDGVVIEIPVGRPKLMYQFKKWTDDDVINISVEMIKYAKEKGLEVVYFGYDTTRADFDFLKRLYDKVVYEGKPDSIGIVDTMGCALPGAVKELINKLKGLYPNMVFEIHPHNDFGLATATCFSAVEAGAEVIHTCINGMGERTGNAALEEVMVGLKILYGIDLPYKIEKLNEVSKRVQEIANTKLAVNKPIVGDSIFYRESGIGIDLVLNTPLAMYAMDPKLIGNKSKVVLGKKSGLKSIDVKLEELKLSLPEDKKDLVLKEIKELGIAKKGILTDCEFKEIINKYNK